MYMYILLPSFLPPSLPPSYLSLSLSPLSLGPFTKEVAVSMIIYNNGPTPIGFKIKSTAPPTQFVVIPNMGLIQPHTQLPVSGNPCLCYLMATTLVLKPNYLSSEVSSPGSHTYQNIVAFSGCDHLEIRLGKPNFTAQQPH